jgi:hypothetical protein
MWPAVWQDESAPAADRLEALTALAHGSEAERGTYAANQALVNELHRQVAGGTAPIVSGAKIDTAAVAQRQERMRELMKDAHRDDDASRRRYAAAQPELLRLAGEIEALKRGEAPATTTAKPEAKALAKPTPVNVTDYGDLPLAEGDSENSVLDDRLWNEALPTFAKLGLQAEQVTKLGKLFRKLEVVAAEARTEAGDKMKEETETKLRKRYGDNLETVLEDANAAFRKLAPDGASKRLGNLRLADGGVLGSHPDFVALMIALRRGRA